MEFTECRTHREQTLWIRLQAAHARIDQLERGRGIAPARVRDRPRPRQRLTPGELRLHRRRCAARARLGRRNLSAAARRRVLQQARAVDAIPPGFDDDAFLRGSAPAQGSTRPSPIQLDPPVILFPDAAPPAGADPQVFALWCANRLAQIEGALDRYQLAQLRTLLNHFPARRAREGMVPPAASRTLHYPGLKRVVARDRGLALWYPNGQRMFDEQGTLHYPCGGVAVSNPSGVWRYPNGRPLLDAAGRWHAPDGPADNVYRLLASVGDAAPHWWPRIVTGFQRLPPHVVPIGVLELAWTLLRPGRR